MNAGKIKNRDDIISNKKDNCGFSLVELIIVIAMVAILIGALVPQYIKYVEKARTSSDKMVIQELASAIRTLASDPEINLNEGTMGYAVVSVAGSNELTVSPGLKEKLGPSPLGNNAVDVTKMPKLKSKIFKEGEVSLSLIETNGIWNLHVTVPEDVDGVEIE